MLGETGLNPIITLPNRVLNIPDPYYYAAKRRAESDPQVVGETGLNPIITLPNRVLNTPDPHYHAAKRRAENDPQVYGDTGLNPIGMHYWISASVRGVLDGLGCREDMGNERCR